ncbi:hypothetical protein DVH24_000529 [Malus domestica]|uniref:Uncharacterized protein n=1 Tax=Malus domestica TaxID=3750 RepID=A0A498J086_MALDO|nr:hypothetical protein DVH24_000529 [Malus domestica]
MTTLSWLATRSSSMAFPLHVYTCWSSWKEKWWKADESSGKTHLLFHSLTSERASPPIAVLDFLSHFLAKNDRTSQNLCRSFFWNNRNDALFFPHSPGSSLFPLHPLDNVSFVSTSLLETQWRSLQFSLQSSLSGSLEKKIFGLWVKEEPRRDMFTEGLDRSALHGVRKSSAPFVPYPILVDPCSIGHLPLFAFLFSPDISASMIRQTRRSRLLSRTRCSMGTTYCSKLSQRSGEICYVAPDYANYEALEKWCGNWLFVIDEKERFFVLHFLLYHLGLCKLFIIGDPFIFKTRGIARALLLVESNSSTKLGCLFHPFVPFQIRITIKLVPICFFSTPNTIPHVELESRTSILAAV